jgi:hypothetical protein
MLATFTKAGKTTKREMAGDWFELHAKTLAWLGLTDAGPVRTKAEADQVEAEARRRYEAAQPRPSRARAR